MQNDKNDLKLLILRHLKTANVDYAFSIARNIGIETEDAVEELEELEDEGFVVKVFGGGLKRTKAKMKRSPEVRKHHTYYTLTKKGKEYLRENEKSKS
jgi:predicted transcriptional regulator